MSGKTTLNNSFYGTTQKLLLYIIITKKLENAESVVSLCCNSACYITPIYHADTRKDK